MTERLSRTQIRMLRNVRDGRRPWTGAWGMSERGGASGTIASLTRRGLLRFTHPGTEPGTRCLHCDVEMTPAGLEALAAYLGEQS